MEVYHKNSINFIIELFFGYLAGLVLPLILLRFVCLIDSKRQCMGMNYTFYEVYDTRRCTKYILIRLSHVGVCVRARVSLCVCV